MEQQYRTIEFSLEKARIDGNKVVTRGGFEVCDWYHFKTSRHDYPITYVNKAGNRITTTINGINTLINTPSDHDLLILEPIKEEVMWGNVYVSDSIITISCQNSLEKANKYKSRTANCQIKITLIDGIIVKTEKV